MIGLIFGETSFPKEVLKKIKKKKIPLMTALLNTITKNKKLKINY